MQKNETAKSAKEIVTEFMQAIERKDWKTVRSHISDNLSVLSPGPFNPITFQQAEAYMYYLEHVTGSPPEIKKVIADGNDVCVTLEVTSVEPPTPVTTLVCGLFHVNDDGKIGSIRFVLDPRELFQKYKSRESETAKSAKEIVTEFNQAMERKDWKAVRSYISDNISDVSPLNSFDGAEAYLKYVEYVVDHRDIPQLDIKKEFVDGNDVCLLYEGTIGKQPVTTILCRWFHVNDDGKISSIRWVFDPRPLFPQK